ncbi:MAG: heavy metal sensor histidine kinase [Thiobacillus sp.]
MRPLSLTNRISALFAVAASLVLLVTAYFLAQAVEAHFKAEDRHELDGKLELIRNLFERAEGPEELAALPRQLDDALIGHHGLAVAVIDATGRLWFTTSGATFPDALLRDCQARPAACTAENLREWEQAGRPYRGMAATMRTPQGGAYTVAIALDIAHHAQFMQEARSVLGLAILLAAAATAVLGWVVTRWGLFPLRRVTATVAGMSAKHLAERLPTTGLPVELQPLASAFNAMLARLDDSFRRLSAFSSDIAHELRTPISNLMTQTQVALSSARGNEEYKEILYSSLEEYERMAQMVGDMLYLAQADHGLLKPVQEKVNLANETRGLFDYFEAWAEERGVALAQTGAATVPGDRLMLRRALSNLLANAIRHTAAGQAVKVSLATQGGQAEIFVDNPGTAIPAEHLPHLFDRFYRVDPARQRAGDGAGLGLAIVKSIVDAHGGSIAVTSSEQRTRFRVVLPTGE